MTENNEYCFVLDNKGNKLSPCKVNKAWYLIRKQRAKLVSKYPMVIELNKEVEVIEEQTEVNSEDKESINEDDSEFILGIDDGSKYVGLAIVQKCKTKNKVIFKGVIELRQDVKHLIDVRRGYRRYRRNHKRYRQARFNNRGNSKRTGRIAPSIKQKKDSILRVLRRLNKWIRIDEIHLEDVLIDIRALTEGNKLYKWQYQKSNRLDENLRKGTILRDGNRCVECGKTGVLLEVHHIVPRRLQGNDSIHNLISLCSECHAKVTGVEEHYIDYFQDKIKGKNINYIDAMHVMQGKNYLRAELCKLGKLELTTGSDTSNRRIDLGIEKSHSNDALVITGVDINVDDCNIREWLIKPMRRKSKALVESCLGFIHRDLVKYTKKNGDIYIGTISALYPNKNQCNITLKDGFTLKRYGLNRCKLLWRNIKIYFI